MRLGIVGSEGGKFTPVTEHNARILIRVLLDLHHPELVVSGACHLGGIDQWGVEEAKARGIQVKEFPPKTHSWLNGYRPRNIHIAMNSDHVVCITVKDLPPGFKEGGWERFCYHCLTKEHIKSGGCWTVKYAKKMGKTGEVIVV